jgi:hypothetical protein
VVEEYAASCTEDYAMRYERLICEIYHCERYGVAAADADRYRKLVNDYFQLVQVQNTPHRLEEEKYQNAYNEILNEISLHLKYSLDNIKVLKQNSYEDIEHLKSLFPLTNILAVNYMIDSMWKVL